jgi:hypothetical protein
MKKLKVRYILFLVFVLINGCDYIETDYFEIDNQLNSPIYVKFYNKYDTGYDYIQSHSKKIILVDEGGLLGRCGVGQDRDSFYQIQSLWVNINDTIIGKKDFAGRENWNFKSLTYTSIFTLVIDTNNFY